MRLEGVCCRSQGQPCSERKCSTIATSRRKDSPSGVRCPEGDCEDSEPGVAIVYLVHTTLLSRVSPSALRGVGRRCYTSRMYDASPHGFSVFTPSPQGEGKEWVHQNQRDSTRQCNSKILILPSPQN